MRIIFYGRYAAYRNLKGFNDEQVACKTGIDYNVFCNWRQDKMTPEKEELEKIASVLSIPYELLSGEEEELHDQRLEAGRRKVLFTYGMSNDFQLIITDAPKEAIEEWCVQYVTDQENGVNYEPFYSLKARYYVKEILDSETEDSSEDMHVIGYDESYDYADFNSKSDDENEEVQKTSGVKYMIDPTVEDLIEFLEQHRGKGLKISVTGITNFSAHVSKEHILFDELDFMEYPTE